MTKTMQYILDNDLQNNYFNAKVLWFRETKGQGIAVMDNGNEIYINLSNDRKAPEKGDKIKFRFNTAIKDCNCSNDYTILN